HRRLQRLVAVGQIGKREHGEGLQSTPNARIERASRGLSQALAQAFLLGRGFGSRNAFTTTAVRAGLRIARKIAPIKAPTATIGLSCAMPISRRSRSCSSSGLGLWPGLRIQRSRIRPTT